MPKAPPAPIPQLDGPPPSPEGISAGPAPASFSGLGAPPPEGGESGGMETISLLLQTAQAVAQGLDILGQMSPAFAGVSAQMQTMLREGMRAALQQGLPGSEPSASPTFSGMGGAV